MALLLSVAMAIGPSGAAFAATANVVYSLSPATKTIANGDNLALVVYEDSGADTINTVQVNMSFPAAGLSLQSVDYSTSDFPGGASGSESSAGPGTIRISRIYTRQDNNGTITYGQTGKKIVATLYFTVTATSGTQNVTFDNTSAAWSPPPENTTQSFPANVTSQGGAYSFATTAPPPPPSGGGGGGGGGASTGTTTPKATSAPKPVSAASNATYTSTSGKLVISDISASNLSSKSATISWTTSGPATSEVDYGLAADQLNATAADATATTAHSLQLDPTNLVAGKTYYFVVKSADSAGNIASSQVLSFETAPGAAASSGKSNTMAMAIGAVAVIALVAIAGAMFIRRMHRRSQSNQDLYSHIATPPPATPPVAGPTSTINGNSVITPDPKDPKNNPPNGTVVG